MTRSKQFDPDEAVSRAAALFWRKGYGSTTPQDLSDEIGIGKGSLYHAFDSKRGLFELALRSYGEARLSALAGLLQGPGPVKDRLRRALLMLANGRGDPPLRGCLAVNTAIELGGSDPRASKTVRSIFDRMELLLVSVVEEGQRCGEINTGRDSVQVAGTLLITIIGLQVLGRASDPPARSHRIIESVIAAL